MILADSAIWRRRMTILAAGGGFYGGVAACDCEIPASAGMVCLGTGDLRAILAVATIWRGLTADSRLCRNGLRTIYHKTDFSNWYP